jgi:hypothetical protein
MEGSGPLTIITDPYPGGLKTARAGRQQEQSDIKGRATARAGRQPVLWNRNYYLRFRFRLLKSYGSSNGSGSGSVSRP